MHFKRKKNPKNYSWMHTLSFLGSDNHFANFSFWHIVYWTQLWKKVYLCCQWDCCTLSSTHAALLYCPYKLENKTVRAYVNATVTSGSTSIKILGAKGATENLLGGGQKLEKCKCTQVKIWYFHAEIVKFGLIHLSPKNYDIHHNFEGTNGGQGRGKKWGKCS